MVVNCTLNMNFQFIIQNGKCTTYILIIFYISQALLNVSMHLHHLQGVLTLYFADVTKLLKLQLNKINRLKLLNDQIQLHFIIHQQSVQTGCWLRLMLSGMLLRVVWLLDTSVLEEPAVASFQPTHEGNRFFQQFTTNTFQT